MWHIGLENTLVRSEMHITYYCKVAAIKSKYWQIFIGQNVKIMTPVIVGSKCFVCGHWTTALALIAGSIPVYEKPVSLDHI